MRSSFLCRSLIYSTGTLSLLLALVSSATAVEPYREFLDALRMRGYGEIAIDYVNMLRARPDLPEDIKLTLDLEMASSLRVAAAETVNADEGAKRLAEAQSYLDKFLKEHPESPQGAAAYVTYGDVAFGKGATLLGAALAYKGKETNPFFEEARASFLEAKPKYTKAVELYKGQYVKLEEAKTVAELAAAPAADDAPAKTAKRPVKANVAKEKEQVDPMAVVEDYWIDARLKLGRVDFSIGRTYTDPKDKARIAALASAGKEFDDVYQHYRTLRSGLYAHMMHGRVAEETGNLQMATDIYDEVLANAPAPPEKVDPVFEALFAEVQQFRLLILSKQGKIDEVIEEGEEWLKNNSKSRKTAGYEAIGIEVARADIAVAEKGKSGAKGKTLLQNAFVLLTDIAKNKGPYQYEAIGLLKVVNKLRGTPDIEIKTMDEALAAALELANEANKSDDPAAWLPVIEAYKKAIDFGKKADAKTAPTPEKMFSTRLDLARCEYKAGKIEDALNSAEQLAQENSSDKNAPLAASLAVSAALSMYSKAEGKPPTLERLQKVADFTVKTWPQRSEAEDARMALGRVDLVRGQYDTAIKTFESVNPASNRLPGALYLAGQTRWVLYLTEKQKGEKANVASIKEHHQKIVEDLKTGIESLHKAPPGDPAEKKTLNDSMLLLGEVYLDSGEAALAVAQLEPIVEAMKKDKPKALDKPTLRAAVAAVRAYVGVKSLDKANGVATLLFEVGEDTPPINKVLIDFAQMVKSAYKSADGLKILADGGDDAEAKKTAEANLKANKELLAKLLEQLAARKQQSLAGMLFVADTCAELGINEKARETYELILEKAKDPEWLGPNAKALTRVRSQLVGLLRMEKKYEQALKEVDQLIADNPKALEPMMERGRILQDWSEVDPKKFPEAVVQWTKLRTLLQRIPGKKRPEYFEVVYNAAYCLVSEAQQLRDKQKASDAETLLKSTMIQSSSVGSQDMLARYKVLLERAIRLQGRKPAAPAPAAATPPAQAAN